MIKNILKITFVSSILSIITNAQTASFDWKLHDVGKVRQVVTNRGGLNAKYDAAFDYPGLINCEHPLGSNVEHITNTGLWVGALLDGIGSVSLADGEAGQIHEFFPTNGLWDTVWVVNKRDIVDIPYWYGYVGVSDQDFVCRYNDYGPISQKTQNHRPLFLDVIMTTYAWASPPLDETIVINFYIIPVQKTLQKVYIGMYMNGNVGDVTIGDYALDDESFFRVEENTQFCRDVPGGSDGIASTVAEKFFPPSAPNLKTTFIWWNGVKHLPPNEILINMYLCLLAKL